MSDVIERIKKRIDKSAIKVSTCRFPHTYIKAVGTKELYKILDEESAKDTQSDVSINLIQEEFEKIREEIKVLAINEYKAKEPQMHGNDEDHVWIDGKQFISLRRFHEKCREIEEKCKNPQEEVKKCLEQFKIATNRQLELESQINNQWIPCSERLPEEMQHVIVTFSKKRRNHSEIKTGYYLGQNRWRLCSFNADFVCDNNDFMEDWTVDAWMPQPEPYKKEV